MSQSEQPHTGNQSQRSPLDSFLPVASVLIKDDSLQGRAIINREIADLCQKVQEHKSIYAGAAEMGMSYGKAWRMIKEVEASLGFPLFSREGCKGSTLTKEASDLLNTYARIQQALSKKAEQLYIELLGQ